MIRYNLSWNNPGIYVSQQVEPKGSGASGQVKEANFWERKYCVTDLTGKQYSLNRGSLIERINKSVLLEEDKLIKGYSWDYLEVFAGATDELIKDKLEKILIQEATCPSISPLPNEIVPLILSQVTNYQTMWRISQLSHAWRKLVNDWGWNILGSKLLNPFSHPRELEASIQKMIRLFLNYPNTTVKLEAYKILKSREIAQLSRFQQASEAANVLSVWVKLQWEIRETALFKIQTFDELISKRRKFPKWCKTHKVKLQGVQTLNLNYLDLTSLPPEIRELPQLQTLILSNNQLSTLPPEIRELSQLKELSLHNNSFTCFPSLILTLTQLQDLIISYNQLTTLPSTIENLSQLQTLNLYSNSLNTIPSEIEKLSHLSYLFLGGNPLSLWERLSLKARLNVEHLYI